MESQPCPPNSGRLYCVRLTTYTNLSRVGGVEVDVQLKSFEQNNMSNPKVKVTHTGCTSSPGLYQVCPTADQVPSGLIFQSSSPNICSLVAGDLTCSLPNLPGNGLSPSPDPVRLFFSVNAGTNVDSIVFTADSTLNESGNDNPGAANPEHRTAFATMVFEDSGSSGATAALPGSTNTLQASISAITNASVRFSGATNPFFARFAADSAPIACLSGLDCFGGQLQTDLSGGATAFNVGNLILWTARLVDPDANENTLRLLHRYDFLPVTATPATDVFSSSVSYVGVDRVQFAGAPPAGLASGTDYYVRSPTTSSFKVSLTKNGPAVNITDSGPFQASRVRIIGDDSAEKYTSCSPSSPPSADKVPSIKATKVTPGDDDLDVCLWDSGNGSIGPGG